MSFDTFIKSARKYPTLTTYSGALKGWNDKLVFEAESDLSVFVDKMRKLEIEYKDKGVQLELQLGGYNSVYLSKIVVPTEHREEGIGTSFMKKLVDLADEYGVYITLSPANTYGGTVGRLKRFYNRFGFVDNKGRKRDDRFWYEMLRAPKTKKLHEATMPKFTDEFRKDINDWVHLIMTGQENFGPYWDLAKKWPEYLLDPNEHEEFHDKVLVKHFNQGIIPKRVDERMRFFSYLRGLLDFHRKYDIKINDFFDWYDNEVLTLYRGMNVDDYEKEVPDGAYLPFTMVKDKAIPFTQPGWVKRSWIDEKERNGVILVVKMKPKDTYFFSNEGDEMEVVVKGPAKIDKVLKVKNGKIVK